MQKGQKEKDRSSSRCCSTFFSTTSRRVRQCRTRVSRDVLRRRLRRLRRRQLRARLGLARAPAERRRVRAPGDHAAGILRRGPVVHEAEAPTGEATARTRAPVPRARPPAWGAFSVQDASRPAYAQQPRAGTSRRRGGFQPAQRRFGDGGYGGVGAGPGLSAPTGRGGDGGYGGLPPRAFERSSAFGTGPGDRGAMQDAAPRRGFADSPLAQALRRADEAASAASAAAPPPARSAWRAPPPPARPLFRGRRAETWRLGVRQPPARAGHAAGATPGGRSADVFARRSSASRGTTPPRTTARLPPAAARASPAARAAARTRPEPPRHPARVARETEAPRGRRRGGSLCTWALTYPRRIPTPPPPRRRRPARSRKPRRWRRGGRPWRRRTQL